MAGHDDTPEVPTSKRSRQERFLTVQLVPEAKPKIPWMAARDVAATSGIYTASTYPCARHERVPGHYDRVKDRFLLRR